MTAHSFIPMRLSLLAAAASLFLALPSVTASAQATYPPQVEEQCRPDYFRFCSPYALGSDELRRCMEAKGRNLSPNCRQALKDAGYVKSSRYRR